MLTEERGLNGRQRFIAVMDYGAYDRVPNYEAGVWEQTVALWREQGMDTGRINWDWFSGDESLGMDPREYFPVNMAMMPPFPYRLLEKTDRYEIFVDSGGRTRKALLEGAIGGARASMDQYLRFPVESPADFADIRRRYEADMKARYPEGWERDIPRWRSREIPLIFGRNCATLGFYWMARDFMGTEALSYAFYDQPALVEAIMEFVADFTIAMAAPFLAATDADYVMMSEDMSMKNGPLLSPALYRRFIFPHMRRMVDFLKGKGVRYVFVDTDGNCEALLPLLLEAGADGVWPLERAADMDPIRLRRQYGRDLRLLGGVDKRVLARGRRAIDEHLRAFVPLVAEGGFIPTVDHTVPPDVSLDNFLYYMARKQELLRGGL